MYTAHRTENAGAIAIDLRPVIGRSEIVWLVRAEIHGVSGSG